MTLREKIEIANKLLHPVAAAVLQEIEVNAQQPVPRWKSADILQRAGPALVELAEKSPLDYLEGIRQLLNVGVELGESFPQSPVGRDILLLIEWAAEHGTPFIEQYARQLGEEEAAELQNRYEQAKSTISDNREQLPDTGERLDKKSLKLPIKG